VSEGQRATERRTGGIKQDATRLRRRASRWEHVFQVTARIRLLSKPAVNATAGGGAGTVGGIWGLVASDPIPPAIGGFVAAVCSLAQWLAPEDAADRQAFHEWRRTKYDAVIDQIKQRRSESTPISEAETKAWGAQVQAIKASNYYEWIAAAIGAAAPEPPPEPAGK
jgi:hypothetical protein